jgi:4-amino-4-deoxy-L-arabinose transferase-like glycosyltransferase
MKRAFEILSLIAVLVLAYWLRVTDPYYLSDLPIVPDCAQYTVAGYNLAHGKGLWIYINDLRLPLNYPCGFPMILALFYLMTGAALHSAIYVVLAFGLLSILLVYFFARSVFGALTALISTLLLAVAPLYVGYSQVLISDMVSNTFIVIGLWLSWTAAVREGRSAPLWILAGISCGFSATVHMLSGITVVPLCAACICGARGRLREGIRGLAYALVGFIAGFSPVLVYNLMAFGTVFTTGYDYWARWGEGQSNFSLSYALSNTAVSERGDGRSNVTYYLWHFLGLSWPTFFAPYFPSVLLLACMGAFTCMRKGRRLKRGRFCFASISASLVLATLLVLFFYSFQMSKFFLPVVPFMCVLAACGIVTLLKVFGDGSVKGRLLRIPVAILLAVTAWGAAKPFMGKEFKSHAPTWWYEGLKTLDRIAPQDAVLISGIDGVYVTHYFIEGTRRRYMPISREVEYVRQRDLPLKVAVEEPGYIGNLLASGKRVYMDGFTFSWWGRYRAELGQKFRFAPVATYYNGQLRIYELLPKATAD